MKQKSAKQRIPQQGTTAKTSPSAGPDGAVLAPPNRTGLPDALKTGVESLSGLSLDEVRVHYNSSKPATLQALAYTQGTDIHVAPGQERHLPHEAWHVVQQIQGRVRPMAQVAGQQVNDDLRLEEDADAMGAKAIRDSRAGVQRKENASREEFSFVSQPKYPIQRAKVNPERVDEENWAEARHGETIRFTDLSAGCMAVTVVFHDSGGGAGVHMLMTKDNATQWAPFSVFVAGKVIDAVFIDGDMIGGRDGWRVKIKYSEEEEGEGEYRITNETGFCPRSGADLMTTYGSLEAAEGAGWTQNTDLIKPWFQELFRTETVELTGKTKGVSHAC